MFRSFKTTLKLYKQATITPGGVTPASRGPPPPPFPPPLLVCRTHSDPVFSESAAFNPSICQADPHDKADLSGGPAGHCLSGEPVYSSICQAEKALRHFAAPAGMRCRDLYPARAALACGVRPSASLAGPIGRSCVQARSAGIARRYVIACAVRASWESRLKRLLSCGPLVASLVPGGCLLVMASHEASTQFTNTASANGT